VEAPSDHDILLALGEDLPVGIWVARVPGGEVVFANRTFTDILGINARYDARSGGYVEPYNVYTRDGAPYPERKMPFVRALAEHCNGAVLLANPKSGLPIVDMCAPEGKGITRSDDKIFRLNEMPLSACGL
jgi:hypothetical protein